MLSDFPTAWNVIKKTPPGLHHEKCSFRQTDGAVLCDCAAIRTFIETVKLSKAETPDREKLRAAAKSNIEYLVTFCGGTLKDLNMEEFLNRLGF